MPPPAMRRRSGRSSSRDAAGAWLATCSEATAQGAGRRELAWRVRRLERDEAAGALLLSECIDTRPGKAPAEAPAMVGALLGAALSARGGNALQTYSYKNQ